MWGLRRIWSDGCVSTSAIPTGKLIGDFRVLMTEAYPDYGSARQREVPQSGRGRAWLDAQFHRP
jgi:hypothetical protein